MNLTLTNKIILINIIIIAICNSYMDGNISRIHERLLWTIESFRSYGWFFNIVVNDSMEIAQFTTREKSKRQNMQRRSQPISKHRKNVFTANEIGRRKTPPNTSEHATRLTWKTTRKSRSCPNDRDCNNILGR